MQAPADERGVCVPLFRSTLPLRVALALTQAGRSGLSLREIARAAEVRDSTAQHAVAVLRDAGVARAIAGTRPRYVLEPGEDSRDVTRLAARHLATRDATSALIRANRGVELGALDERVGTLYVVYAEDAQPSDEVLLSDALRLLPRLQLVSARHDQFIEATLLDRTLRDRVQRGRILKGTAARSLPDRTRHGDFRRARRLGGPHPSLRSLAKRRLESLARRHALSEIGLFGSAVRRDFRADSDVDVLVRYAPGARPSLDDRVALEHELERLLERDVDVVDAAELREELRPAIEAEVVTLYGRS